MMGYTRKYLSLLLASLFIFMVGCSSGSGNAGEEVGKKQESIKQEKEKEKETDSKTKDTSGEPRKVTDELGHGLNIPAEPQRIIGIYLEDELKALGVTPLRQSRIGEWSGQSYLDLGIPDIDIQGDVEAFIEAQPDLILTNVYDEKIYGTLSKVAPFYAFKDARADWRATIKVLGELFGKSDKAAEVIAAYDSKTAEAGEKVRAAVGDETVAIVRVHTKSIRLYGGPGYAGPVVYGELGLNPPQMVKDLVLDKNLGVANISMEVIPQLTADHIFLTMDTGAEQQYKDLTENGLWKNLPAVKNGHVYEVNFETWMKSGPIADGMKVEDIVQALIK